MNDTQKKMIEEFQCPGCVSGPMESGCYQKDTAGFWCNAHVAGTIVAGIGVLNLGLPKGFNRLCDQKDRQESRHNNIRLFESPDEMPEYDHLNVPIWAYETRENDMDVLIVRCYCPRVNWDFVDVILGGTVAQVREVYAGVYDVSKFIEDID